MARFRAADAPAARKDRQPMRAGGDTVMMKDGFGEDPYRVFAGRQVSQEASVKQDEPEDDIALPTPISQGCWKVISPDGHEVSTHQPIPGFEHLLNGPQPSQGQPSTARSANIQAPAPGKTSCRAPAQPHQQGDIDWASSKRNVSPAKAALPQPPKQKTLKRCRSVARRLTQPSTSRDASDDDDDEDEERDVTVTNETSNTFYIGDFAELKKFFRRRLNELTMKPLRPIITAWIKQLEPRRLGAYGPYHKSLPSEQPAECTPPWWPRDVAYAEPSHLEKSGLLKLAVDVMLQHRSIDEAKRRGSWVAKLRQAAQYAIETTPPEQFSSSRGSGFSEKMRERALNEVLPSLFDAAQLYEDHLAQYMLYEGSGNTDPGNGTYYTWQAVSKPPRQSQRKRARRTRATQARKLESDVELSGDETDVDDTISNSFLRRQEQDQAHKRAQASQGSNAVEAPRPQVPETPTPTVATCASVPSASQQNIGPNSSMPTPNTSFDGPMKGLRLVEDMDMEAKSSSRAQYNGQALMCNMFAFSQPMQYSSSHPAYSNQVFPPQANAGSFSDSAQSPFATGPATGFVNPFSVFNTPYTCTTQAGNANFAASIASSNAGFPYEYEGMFPPTLTPAQPNDCSHGLPVDFNLDC